MTKMLDILQDFCEFREYKFCRLDGSTKYNLRDEEIQSFVNQKSEKFIFLISTRAGGNSPKNPILSLLKPP